MSLRALGSPAARHDVDVTKLRKKKEIAASLVMSLAAQAIYDEVRPQLEAVVAAPAPPRPSLPPLDAPDADGPLYASKNPEGDLRRAGGGGRGTRPPRCCAT